MSNETEQKPTPHRTRIEVSVEFDEIPGQPQQPLAVVCCKELPVRLYEAAVNLLDIFVAPAVQAIGVDVFGQLWNLVNDTNYPTAAAVPGFSPTTYWPAYWLSVAPGS